jgi:hypothetical protein
MPRLLNILTTKDAFALDLIERERALSHLDIEVFDLTQEPVDYQSLLERIFAADNVHVW